eukprot:5087529-Alexandrium_andersonii.AAC.1
MGVEWAPRLTDEPLRTYHARLLEAADHRPLARRAGNGSCLGFARVTPEANPPRGMWHIQSAPRWDPDQLK